MFKEPREKNVSCPTCGAPAKMSWAGLDLVATSGDETLASKVYQYSHHDVDAMFWQYGFGILEYSNAVLEKISFIPSKDGLVMNNPVDHVAKMNQVIQERYARLAEIYNRNPSFHLQFILDQSKNIFVIKKIA